MVLVCRSKKPKKALLVQIDEIIDRTLNPKAEPLEDRIGGWALYIFFSYNGLTPTLSSVKKQTIVSLHSYS
jgi:hypothetical protein